jgi:hypothetical protein
MNPKYSTLLACIGLAGLFFLLGVAFIPLAGAQYDEVLFLMTFMSPDHVAFSYAGHGHKVPLMVMTYLGTLKAYVMQPIFDLLGYNHRTLRLPALAFATVSLGLFFLALRRIVAYRVALIAVLLLATDAGFLLTSVFDWGPVALQHLFLAVVLYCGVRYSVDRLPRWLVIGGLASGLALWDKAISIWVYGGGGLALALVYRREVWDVLRKPRLAAAFILPALIGASPLIYYNYKKPMATAHSVSSNDDLAKILKVRTMDESLGSGGLLGYIVRDVPEGQARPLRFHERASLWLSARVGSPRRSFQQVVLVVSLLAVPLMLWGPYRRIALFTSLAFLLSWALMMMTKGGGGSLHHTLLLWPLPHLLAGLTLAEIARRLPKRGFKIAAAVFLFAAASNLAMLNQYYAQAVAYGPTTTWTNAGRPLAEAMGAMQGRIAYPVDWGVGQQLDFYGGGRLGLVRGADGFPLHMDNPDARRFVEAMLARPEIVYVTHTAKNEAFLGVREKLLEAASVRGYSHHLLNVIHDSHNVPIFEIHEFRK